MDRHEQPPPERPVLRLTSRADADPPDPADGPYAIERLDVLTHELANLLDGSMRCLSLARRLLDSRGADDDPTHRASRQLQTVYAAMERMADLVHAAMQGSGSVVGSATINPSRPITVAEAVAHAAEVVRPEADGLGVAITLSIADGLAAVPAGPIYSVVLNGLRNGIESIARTGQPGSVEIRAALRAAPGTAPLVVIEVLDDGRGLASREDAARAFRFGYSSKPGGLGVGLALAREVVRELGGAIDLCPREDRLGAPRPGAVLRIVYPPPKDRGRQKVG